jgi:hypothetical protein
MSYEQLDPDKIIQTVETLHRRIAERFPDSGLTGVCQKLLEISRAARQRSAAIASPLVSVRLLTGLIIVLIVASAVWTGWIVYHEGDNQDTLSAAELIQVLEAGLNDIVLIGATVFFLVTLETRIKRSRALKAIHELRSIAHIIDMHQLTKDPERLLGQGKDTKSSPKRTMTEFELSRYLDYCSEMLSITGKVAALYVQSFHDSAAVSAVNELENLTTSLARKVWQKIVVLHTFEEARTAKAVQSGAS